MHRVWACWQHGWDTVWPLAMWKYSFLHYSLCLLHILVHWTEQSTQTAPLFLLWESGRDTRKGWVCQRATECYLCYQFTFLMKRNIKAHLIQLSVPGYPKCRALCKITTASLRFPCTKQNNKTCVQGIFILYLHQCCNFNSRVVREITWQLHSIPTL